MLAVGTHVGINLGGNIFKPLVHMAASFFPLIKSFLMIGVFVGVAIVGRFWYKLRKGPNVR